MTSRAYSCFVDDDPILKAQAFIWINCLKRLQRIDPAYIFVHTPGGRSQFRDWLIAEAVNVVEVERFDPRNNYCNKIQQLATFCQAEFDHGTFDQIVLMDCDTAWIGNEALPLGLPAAACIVDRANPPESVIKEIFSASGLGLPDWWPVASPRGPDLERTDVNNCNGGLYIFAKDFVGKLAPQWRKWALWCLDNIHLFESSSKHADQVGFALAMRELNEKVSHLPQTWNYPTHMRLEQAPDAPPQILHYHRALTSHLQLKTVGISTVDRAIAGLNKRIAGFMQADVPNAVFWDFRYCIDPDLGSRGANLESKRKVLKEAVKPFDNGKIVDVGCGDLEATRHLDVEHYVGLDISAAALRIARGKRPDWTFRAIETDERIPEADAVLCIDVLIHQPSERHFVDLIGRLAAAARRRLIVSGYEDPPTLTSEITRYYGPVSEALRRTGAFATVQILGRDGDLVIVAADKREAETTTVTAQGSSLTSAKVVVGSGWWCDEVPHEWALGSLATRSPAFFDLWYRQVLRCLRPERVVVTDSASPIKPDVACYDNVQWIELDKNYGHANDIRTRRIKTKYSGFTRSVINGAMYALCCDADFYVYVEQDCLLFGDGFLAQAVGDSSEDILLGAAAQNAKGIGGVAAAPMLQQSLIIVRRPALERFLIALLGSPKSDGEVPPEETMRTRLAPFDFLRVPYGRSRPIDFDRPHYYAQHFDDHELSCFKQKLESIEIGPSAESVTGGARCPAGTTSGALERGDRSSSPAMSTELVRELEAWKRAGKKARLWWRDDDAAVDTPDLRRLLGLADEVGAVVALAVIPSHADETLVKRLAGGPCCVWQHGWRHHWQYKDDEQRYSQGEFGNGRDLERMMADARDGRLALDRLFGEQGWQQVFVPPFHALSVPFKALLPSLGYWGLSAGHPLTPPVHTVREINAEIDIMDWPKRALHGPDVIAKMLVDQLASRRRGEVSAEAAIGLLTHHLALDEAAWRYVEELFRFLSRHDATQFIAADQLFEQPLRNRTGQPHASSGSSAEEALCDDVTVVVTSCGRQDLLEVTLDSFLRHNTHPIREFVVIEDGDGDRNIDLMKKYAKHPFTWLATGHRVGQIQAIDIAYQAVSTDLVFHCEDDWEFFAPGFTEKSIALLRQNQSIVQVWLRALDDTNRHPVLDFTLTAEGIPYRLLRHNHDAGKWGIWHGFSWNPGLRRRRDYDVLGSFGSLDPDAVKETWRVESEASAFYQQRGMFAAILADNGGSGYARHIGRGRRVRRDFVERHGPGERTSGTGRQRGRLPHGDDHENRRGQARARQQGSKLPIGSDGEL